MSLNDNLNDISENINILQKKLEVLYRNYNNQNLYHLENNILENTSIQSSNKSINYKNNIVSSNKLLINTLDQYYNNKQNSIFKIFYKNYNSNIRASFDCSHNSSKNIIELKYLPLQLISYNGNTKTSSWSLKYDDVSQNEYLKSLTIISSIQNISRHWVYYKYGTHYFPNNINPNIEYYQKIYLSYQDLNKYIQNNIIHTEKDRFGLSLLYKPSTLNCNGYDISKNIIELFDLSYNPKFQTFRQTKWDVSHNNTILYSDISGEEIIKKMESNTIHLLTDISGLYQSTKYGWSSILSIINLKFEESIGILKNQEILVVL